MIAQRLGDEVEMDETSCVKRQKNEGMRGVAVRVGIGGGWFDVQVTNEEVGAVGSEHDHPSVPAIGYEDPVSVVGVVVSITLSFMMHKVV